MHSVTIFTVWGGREGPSEFIPIGTVGDGLCDGHGRKFRGICAERESKDSEVADASWFFRGWFYRVGAFFSVLAV